MLVWMYCRCCLLSQAVHNIPASFVCMGTEMLYGPVPMLFSAVIAHRYVLNGLSCCITRLVVVEDTWKVSPVAIAVTFMR